MRCLAAGGGLGDGIVPGSSVAVGSGEGRGAGPDVGAAVGLGSVAPVGVGLGRSAVGETREEGDGDGGAVGRQPATIGRPASAVARTTARREKVPREIRPITGNTTPHALSMRYNA